MASCGDGGGCGGGGCQSQRLSPEGEAEDARERLENVSIAGKTSSLCSKCGLEVPAHNGLCVSCFRAQIFGKFKLAVTSNAMICPTDKVLVAFSGGAASRVVLQFVHEMQCKALKSWDASKSQALPVFGVGIAFIDESVISLGPSLEIDKAIGEIKEVVSELSPPHKELHITSFNGVYSLGWKDGINKLNELLGTVTDATGREDLLYHLRLLSLQKIAVENKYNKLVLGSCTSTIARHVISATVKGQGYSLPADVQYVDARWEVPIVLPLRDCLEQELDMLCRLDSLKTWKFLSRPCTGINGLVSSFITRLVDENPSRERTIVRTAGKLKPFAFNKLNEDDYQEFLPSRLRPKFQNVKNEESTTAEVLCSICGSPLTESDLRTSRNHDMKFQKRVEIFVAHCCQSCNFQILPREEVFLEHFYTVLPPSVIKRVNNDVHAKHNRLREQIKDCLLSDDDGDDET